ncbi:hypothetical protein CLS_10520 [[Clostridium] cf. saccharolyticum K10]|nr:hypothetical protein CLS_10520 [[Clostridium] cf. saccharolyticum K10]
MSSWETGRKAEKREGRKLLAKEREYAYNVGYMCLHAREPSRK